VHRRILDDPTDHHLHVYDEIARELDLAGSDLQVFIRFGGHNALEVSPTEKDRATLKRLLGIS
jgi:hypothetical protein